MDTETIDDGGPAFPTETGPGHEGGFQSGSERWHAPGLSMRDYFAAAALTGMLASPNRSGSFDVFALDAYAYADAMICARKEK